MAEENIVEQQESGLSPGADEGASTCQEVRNGELWKQADEAPEPGVKGSESAVDRSSGELGDEKEALQEQVADNFIREFHGDDLREGFEEAFEKVRHPADATDILEGSAETVATLGESLSNTGRALDEFGPGLGEMAEAHGREGNELTEAVTGIAGEVAEAAVEWTGSVAGPILESAGEVVRGAGLVVDGAVETVDAVAHGDLETAAENLQILGEEAAKVPKNLAGLGLQAAQDVVEGAVAELVEGVAEVGREVGEAAVELTGIWDDDEPTDEDRR